MMAPSFPGMTLPGARPDPDPLAAAPPLGIQDVFAAAERLKGIVRETPVHTSRTLDGRTGAAVFLKCENFQRTGAFKLRGAYNALAQLGEQERRAGVITYSSGNHAQAIALAGKLLGIRTVVVMPSNAPAVKAAATRGYGAEVVQYASAPSGASCWCRPSTIPTSSRGRARPPMS
jgi:threonine dehydratase